MPCAGLSHAHTESDWLPGYHHSCLGINGGRDQLLNSARASQPLIVTFNKTFNKTSNRIRNKTLTKNYNNPMQNREEPHA